jgi:hypothetical protein
MFSYHKVTLLFILYIHVCVCVPSHTTFYTNFISLRIYYYYYYYISYLFRTHVYVCMYVYIYVYIGRESGEINKNIMYQTGWRKCQSLHSYSGYARFES